MTTIDEIMGLVDDALFLRLTIDQVNIRAKITKAIAEARAEGAREMRQAARLTDVEMRQLAEATLYSGSIYDRVRAIETAVLAANGLTK